MRNKSFKVIALLLIVMTIMSAVTVASPATSFTWTLNSKNKWTKTQDAYLPDQTLVALGLKEPEDLFIKDNLLYIADTGNKRIMMYDIEKNEVASILEDDHIEEPKGVFVQNNKLYVADSGAEAVLIFDEDYNFIEAIGRPTDIAYGNTPYKPMKVSVDTKGNMYIIGEGVLNGIIQLSNGGKFLGYFATNKVELNFLQELQDMFFTEEQMDNLSSRVPITITNTFVDTDNTVYSTTIGSKAKNRIAKHNTAGKNIFSDDLLAVDDLIDVYVDENGVIYAASLYGLVWVYTDDGLFVHAFGGNHQTEDVAGLFTNLNSIAVDSTGRIWAADSTTSYVQSFVPTEYSTEIYRALDAFKNGRYLEAEELWLSILNKNQMLKLAHEGLGKIYLYTERYEQAMVHLEIANSKDYYSEAFWEVRNVWLQSNLTMIIMGLILLLFGSIIFKYFNKRKDLTKPFRMVKNRIKSIKILDDVLFVFSFLRHPVDSYYDLKYKKRGSLTGALIIYASFFLIYLHSYIGRDFLFSVGPIEEIDFNAVILTFFVLTLLFVYTNYLVTSIKDGDGTLKEIFLLVAYAFGPLIISTLSVTVLSYVLSFNEEFFIQLIDLIAIVWFAVLVIVGLVEIHDYSIRTAIKSVVLSALFMLVIAIVLLIVILMGEQVFDFFESIVREVVRNVTTP